MGSGGGGWVGGWRGGGGGLREFDERACKNERHLSMFDDFCVGEARSTIILFRSGSDCPPLTFKGT